MMAVTTNTTTAAATMSTNGVDEKKGAKTTTTGTTASTAGAAGVTKVAAGTSKTNPATKYDFRRYGTAHVPEDKDQRLVQTPYGRAVVLRTFREDASNPRKITMRELELLDWKRAAVSGSSGSSGGGRPRRPATLYSPAEFASIQPSVGDDVVCPYGRGRVLEVRGPPSGDRHDRAETVVVELSSWRLAQRSRVRCILQRDAVHVVRKKKQYEMSVFERVEYAQQLKDDANREFRRKNYSKALEMYATAVDAVRYVQHKSDSTNHVRADLIVVMVTCSNNAATCCMQLSQYDRAISFSKNALILIDALEEQKGKKIHTLLNAEGIPDAKFFGEWRVKSYLVMARAQAAKKNNEEAIETLKKAHAVVATYTSSDYTSKFSSDGDEEKAKTVHSSVQHLLANGKEIKKLRDACVQRRKQEKIIERKRAQAMFGGGGGGGAGGGGSSGNSSSSSSSSVSNGGTSKESPSSSSQPSKKKSDDETYATTRPTTTSPEIGEIEEGPASSSTAANAKERNLPLSSASNGDGSGTREDKRPAMKKSVSFSDETKVAVYDPHEGGGIDYTQFWNCIPKELLVSSSILVLGIGLSLLFDRGHRTKQ